MGGAPANFSYHASALGAEALLISRVGSDVLGREALDRFKNLGLPVAGIEVDQTLPTGTVHVEVAADGQPRYEISENVAWDALRGETADWKATGQAHGICFGSLAQRSEPSRSTIRALVANSPGNALRIFDVNLRQRYFSKQIVEDSLNLANVLKVNETELPQLAEMLGLAGDPRTQISRLADRYNLRTVAYTRGGGGSLLFKDGAWSDHPGIRAHVVDTVGAGDSFTAALAFGLMAGWDLDRVNDSSNRLAAYVCACPGGMPPLPEKLRELFK